MSGIDKGFLFGILTEVLRGNKRSTLNSTEEIKMRKLQIILGIMMSSWNSFILRLRSRKKMWYENSFCDI